MNSRIRNSVARSAVAVLVAVALLVLATPAVGLAGQGGRGNAGNPGILPPHSRAFGSSYAEWAATWWTWVLSIPEEVNPLFDTTGANCAVGQSGHVWFLAGTTGADGPVTRTCEIPEGKALFFPLLNYLWVDYPEDHPFDEENARGTLAWLMDLAGDVTCEIDGRPVRNIDRYRGPSAVFDLPADNLYGYPTEPPPGDPNEYYGPCVDDGYYLLLAPLAVGEHTIRFTGGLFWEGEPFFYLDVTYNITVVCRDH